MDFVKCKVKLNRKLFPRDFHKSGEFAIMKFNIVEIIEGNSLLEENEIFKGNMCEIEYGEIYTVTAEEIVDEKWGKQYQIKYIGQPAPLNSEEEQKIFLSRILTENQVEMLYSTFKNPMEIIRSRDIEALCQVKGIGVFTAEKIIDKVFSAVDYSQAYVELDKYGLSNNLIEKLIGVYKSPEVVINKIKENPYILADEVSGIGFRKADEIALANEYTLNDPRRLLHLSKYILTEEANNGHSYIHAYDFMDRIEQETDDLSSEILGDVIKENNDFYAFDLDGERHISLTKIYNLEKKVATELIRINNGENNFDYGDWELKIKKLEERQGWKYTDEQYNAIRELLTNQVLLVTGYGGTGKSSTVSAMTEVLSGYGFAQTALSGRASSRMQEITGEAGYTIHRLLGYNPRTGFFYNSKNQLDVDIVVVDEVSMIGGEIFLRLLEAIKTGAKLVLLGDEGQLESIGTMNILHDLLKSDVIKSCRLTKIHRQAQKSGIIETSMKVRNGEQLFDSRFTGQKIIGELEDFVLNVVKDSTDLPGLIERQFEEQMQNISNICELQVIVPLKDRGNIGCFQLNIKLQDIYNPIKEGIKTKRISLKKNKREFEIRIGDKVINRKNNYKTFNINGENTPIFNGNIGIVQDINEENKTMVVDFNGIGLVYISKDAIDGIELGYCITTHSSQGSQFDVVIYALDHSAFMLLNKEQVYTGITRAKKFGIMNVENRSLRHAISTSEVKNKQTFLAQLLEEIKT
jgi:exodeoxyribonuclease V alpha subunit